MIVDSIIDAECTHIVCKLSHDLEYAQLSIAVLNIAIMIFFQFYLITLWYSKIKLQAEPQVCKQPVFTLKQNYINYTDIIIKKVASYKMLKLTGGGGIIALVT